MAGLAPITAEVLSRPAGSRVEGELLVILMAAMFNTQPNTMLWFFCFPISSSSDFTADSLFPGRAHGILFIMFVDGTMISDKNERQIQEGLDGSRGGVDRGAEGCSPWC